MKTHLTQDINQAAWLVSLGYHLEGIQVVDDNTGQYGFEIPNEESFTEQLETWNRQDAVASVQLFTVAFKAIRKAFFDAKNSGVAQGLPATRIINKLDCHNLAGKSVHLKFNRGHEIAATITSSHRQELGLVVTCLVHEVE